MKEPKLDSEILKARYKALNEKFPDIINKKIVLSKKIIPEIQEALGVSQKEAIEFCNWYRGIKYKELLIEGADRYNLKGEITGQVTPEEAKRAREIIEYRKSQKTVS